MAGRTQAAHPGPNTEPIEYRPLDKVRKAGEVYTIVRRARMPEDYDGCDVWWIKDCLGFLTTAAYYELRPA